MMFNNNKLYAMNSTVALCLSVIYEIAFVDARKGEVCPSACYGKP